MYHLDLLKQASGLINQNSGNPTQADLRRAVSAAYYALFHFLISETIAHWRLDSSRDALGRMFEHSVMKKASRKISDDKLYPFAGENPTVVQKLRSVARVFVELQDQRHVADYDNTRIWTDTEALEQVEKAVKAFNDWLSIEHHTIAQDYLVSLLIKLRD
jgi:uncharacterized protein (UPF0332 family)